MFKDEQRHRNKQDALAEYYRQLDAQMKENYDAHLKLAYSPEQQKLAKLRGIENKNHDEMLKKQSQNDDNDHLNRMKNNQILVDENDKMRKKKEFDKQLERMKDMEDDMKAKGELDAYRIGQELDLEEQRRKKYLYKQTLLYQQAMNVSLLI